MSRQELMYRQRDNQQVNFSLPSKKNNNK